MKSCCELAHEFTYWDGCQWAQRLIYLKDWFKKKKKKIFFVMAWEQWCMSEIWENICQHPAAMSNWIVGWRKFCHFWGTVEKLFSSVSAKLKIHILNFWNLQSKKKYTLDYWFTVNGSMTMDHLTVKREKKDRIYFLSTEANHPCMCSFLKYVTFSGYLRASCYNWRSCTRINSFNQFPECLGLSTVNYLLILQVLPW